MQAEQIKTYTQIWDEFACNTTTQQYTYLYTLSSKSKQKYNFKNSAQIFIKLGC